MLTHKGTVPITTVRLTLKKFERDHIHDMFRNWANDDEVTKYLTWPTHKNMAITQRVVESWVQSYESPTVYHWAIYLEEIKEVIGSISVVSLSNENEKCEIGYCIGKKYWNRGIVTEALKAVLEFLFREVGMQRIAAYFDSENIASGKVMKKAGMSFEGTMRKYTKDSNGNFKDCKLYSILKEEFFYEQGI